MNGAGDATAPTRPLRKWLIDALFVAVATVLIWWLRPYMVPLMIGLAMRAVSGVAAAYAWAVAPIAGD